MTTHQRKKKTRAGIPMLRYTDFAALASRFVSRNSRRWGGGRAPTHPDRTHGPPSSRGHTGSVPKEGGAGLDSGAPPPGKAATLRIVVRNGKNAVGSHGTNMC